MPALLESIKLKTFKSTNTKIRAYVSGKLKLAEGGYIFLNGIRLVHGPKGMFLSFPAKLAAVGAGDYKQVFFLAGADKKSVEQQAIHTYNRQMAR